MQYPDSSPVGEAMQQLGDLWQAAAERYAQRKAQQQAFDTEIAARRLNGELAQAEADAVAHSPADGAGLHDVVSERALDVFERLGNESAGIRLYDEPEED